MTVSILAAGIRDLERYFEHLPEIANEALVMSINDVSSKKGMTLIKKTMRDQVAFPKGYLEKGRLTLFRKALRSRPEATIRGRDRATSLARFALPGQKVGERRKYGTKVMVQPGVVKSMRRAFLIKLKSGNVGLAMRLRDGEAPEETQGAVYLGKNRPKLKNIWAFYGPSVDQVFRDVSDEVKPEVAAMIEKEFYRQFSRLARRG